MTRTRALTLPHGALAGKNLERDVELRVPTGEDELYVLQADRTRAERVTALLERCVVSLGAQAPAPGAVRSLVTGDREALLLHLRALTFGGRLDCALDCPACAEPMDLELSIEDLLVDSYADPREEYEAVLDDGCVVHFRLPTGDDLHEVASLPVEPRRAAAVLLERCIIENAAPDATPATPEIHETLAQQMADLDPQAEVRLVMTCPECGGDVSTVLDAAGPVLDELAPSTDELYAELHLLALHYHWSEHDILALEVPSRRRYLALIADSPAIGAVA